MEKITQLFEENHELLLAYLLQLGRGGEQKGCQKPRGS